MWQNNKMMEWTRSQEAMESLSSRNVWQPNRATNLLHASSGLLTAVINDEDTGQPAAKRSRSDLSLWHYGQPNDTNDSLVEHLARNTVWNESNSSELLMMRQASSAIPGWLERARHDLLSTPFSASHHGPELFRPGYNSTTSTTSALNLPISRFLAERERYIQEATSYLLEHTPPSPFSGVVTGAALSRDFLLPSYPDYLQEGSLARSSFAVMPSKRAREQVSPEQMSLGAVPVLACMDPTYSMLHSLQHPPSPQLLNCPTSILPPLSEEELKSFNIFLDSTTSSSNAADNDKTPKRLPALLALPEDRFKLSIHQILLRHQIEAFEATEDDVECHVRGRNKRIQLGQVGIRCRHCAHLPMALRQKGSVYFPATLLAVYQAAQNMSASHLQCGQCTQLPVDVKRQFIALLSTRAQSSGAGRPYWAFAAKRLGLVDGEDGIRFIVGSDGDQKVKGSSTTATL